MQAFDLMLHIAKRPDISDADKLVAQRVISQVIFAEVEAGQRVAYFCNSIATQLNENDNPIIPPFMPTEPEVEKLQAGFLAQGWDLHYYEPDHNFPKGVFYCEKTR